MLVVHQIPNERQQQVRDAFLLGINHDWTSVAAPQPLSSHTTIIDIVGRRQKLAETVQRLQVFLAETRDENEAKIIRQDIQGHTLRLELMELELKTANDALERDHGMLGSTKDQAHAPPTEYQARAPPTPAEEDPGRECKRIDDSAEEAARGEQSIDAVIQEWRSKKTNIRKTYNAELKRFIKDEDPVLRTSIQQMEQEMKDIDGEIKRLRNSKSKSKSKPKTAPPKPQPSKRTTATLVPQPLKRTVPAPADEESKMAAPMQRPSKRTKMNAAEHAHDKFGNEAPPDSVEPSEDITAPMEPVSLRDPGTIFNMPQDISDHLSANLPYFKLSDKGKFDYEGEYLLFLRLQDLLNIFQNTAVRNSRTTSTTKTIPSVISFVERYVSFNLSYLRRLRYHVNYPFLYMKAARATTSVVIMKKPRTGSHMTPSWMPRISFTAPRIPVS